jgi:hypothetical protein
MEQLFWQNNENREKFDLLFLRNFLTQKAASFCRAQNNSLAFSSLRHFACKRYSQPLLFAKISDVIANRTFSEQSEGSRSLTKIFDAFQKSSPFLGVREGLPSAKIFNGSHKLRLEVINEIWKER